MRKIAICYLLQITKLPRAGNQGRALKDVRVARPWEAVNSSTVRLRAGRAGTLPALGLAVKNCNCDLLQINGQLLADDQMFLFAALLDHF